jgi:hypothetical protein
MDIVEVDEPCRVDMVEKLVVNVSQAYMRRAARGDCILEPTWASTLECYGVKYGVFENAAKGGRVGEKKANDYDERAQCGLISGEKYV